MNSIQAEKSLNSVRDQWETGLEVVGEVVFREDTALAVLMKSDGSYQCNRYFFFQDAWVASVDAASCDANAAIAWLANGSRDAA